jgi:hypothetical protein
MSKFREFFLTELTATGGWKPSYNVSGARLGGRLGLTNINAIVNTGRTPVGGWGSISDLAQKRNMQAMYTANYPGTNLKYGEVQQGLYHLAEIATQVDEILVRVERGEIDLNNPQQLFMSIDMAYIKNSRRKPGNDRIIERVDQRAFTGTYGISTLPTFKVGETFKILTPNAVDNNCVDINTTILEQDTVKAGQQINQFNIEMDRNQLAARALDTGMDALKQSGNGVQLSPSLNYGQAAMAKN